MTSRTRKWLKRLGITLGVILLLPVFVLGLALIALQFPPVRTAARDQLLGLVTGSLQGRLEVDDLRWPSLRHVELSGVRLWDRHQKLVATVGMVTARVKLAPLFSGEVQLSEVSADGVFVDLGTPGTDRGLLSVFESKTPEPEPPPEEQGSALVVQIDRLCLEGSALEVQPTPDQGIGFHRFSTCARFRMAETIDLRLDALRGHVALNGRYPIEFIDEPALRAYDANPPQAISSPARAFLKGQLSIADAGMGFDGRLEVRGINRPTLEAAGIDGSILTAAADVSVVADGDSSKMNYTAEVRAPESRLRVQGDFVPNQGAQTRIWSDGLQLARFTTIGTEKIVFALGVKADLTRANEPRMAAALESGSYGAWALPKVNADAELAKDGTITVPRFEARYPAGEVRGRARVGAGGALYAALDAELRELAKIPPIASTLPGWNGRLQAKAEVRRAAETGNLVLDAQTTIERVRSESPALAAERVTFRASGSGPADRLAVKANLSASELHFQDQRFAEVQLAAGGGPELYKLQGQVDGDRGKLDAWVKTSEAGLEAGGELKAKLPRGVASASVERVLVAGNSLEISQLRAEHLGAKLTAGGSLGLGDEKSALEVEARVDNVSALTHELAGADVPGKLFLTANIGGALDKPKVDLSLDYRDGPRLAGAQSQLGLQAKLDAAKGQAQVKVKGLAGKAELDAELNSRWRRGAPLSAAIDGHHELDLNLDRVSIGALVRESGATLPMPLAGTIAAKLHAKGNRKGVELKSEVGAKVTVGEEPELGVKLTTNYGNGGLAFSGEVIDPHGNLVTINWHQATRLEAFTEKPFVLPDWLGMTDWEATVEVASRRISELPTIRTQKTLRELWPLRSELSIQLAHKADAEPIGDVKMKASWDPSGYDPRHADCTQKLRPTMELNGKLREGMFVSELKGGSGDKQMLRVKSQLGSTLEEWLEGRWLQITKAQIEAHLQDFDLAQWPIACESAAGVLSAAFSAKDLFDRSAQFHAKLNGERMVVGESVPFDFGLQAQALPDGMDVAVRLDRIGGHATIEGSLPISVHVGDPATSVDPNGPIALDLMLARVDAKSLLALVPVVARPSGAFDGNLKVYGTLTQPRGTGSIRMHDVSFTLPKLGQRLSKVNGSIGIADNKVQIPELQLKDQGGTAKFRAELEMQSTKAFDVQLDAKFDDFPVRKLGVLIGRADAAAKVQLKATEEKTDVEVKLREVSVNLTGDTGANVQSLEPHAEIFVEGEPHPGEEEQAEQEEAQKEAAVLNVFIRSDEPLWVRRDDFAVRMSPNVTVQVAGGTSSITGEVKLERGYIALLGQQFDIKEGRVTFTGGQEVNPQLELTAESKTPGGSVVRVDVTGFVSAPKLAFSVDDQTVTAGEALIALTGRDSGSQGSEESMQDQVASAAIGMTTGLLSLGARREFGDFIPMLSIDQTTDDTRVRAGFEVDKLIPEFMRGFVRGAYVEGVVSTQGENPRGNSEGGGSAQAGVLLELLLPSDFVWAGQYGPGQTWSVDLNWQP